jgi:hypothetical protein
MNNTILLQKLIAIEKSIGMADNATIRQLVYEAEDYLLQLQKDHAQSFFRDSWRANMPRFHVVGEVSQNQ